MKKSQYWEKNIWLFKNKKKIWQVLFNKMGRKLRKKIKKEINFNKDATVYKKNLTRLKTIGKIYIELLNN